MPQNLDTSVVDIGDFYQTALKTDYYIERKNCYAGYLGKSFECFERDFKKGFSDAHQLKILAGQTILVVLSGGNVDADIFARAIQQ